MVCDQALTERMRALLAELTSVTVSGTLRWERQLHSAHRYAGWKDSLLILGPTAVLDDYKTPRYLFLIPFNAPSSIEIRSNDVDLRVPLALIQEAEMATAGQEPREPFALLKKLCPVSDRFTWCARLALRGLPFSKLRRFAETMIMDNVRS